MDTKKLEEFLKEKLVAEVDDEFSSSFTEKSPVTCEMTEVTVGKWLCIKAMINYTGTTMDQSTDRASGDPEDVHAWYNWIGLPENAPEKVAHPDELDSWALLSTYYRLTFRDVQYPAPFGHHEGRTVKTFTEDGKGVMLVVKERRFQDVSPASMCITEAFDMNEIEKKKKKE